MSSDRLRADGGQQPGLIDRLIVYIGDYLVESVEVGLDEEAYHRQKYNTPIGAGAIPILAAAVLVWWYFQIKEAIARAR